MPIDPASLLVIIKPFLWLFKPLVWAWKGIVWLKTRCSQLFLEDQKAKFQVRSQITLATYNHRREARQKIRAALTRIEEANSEARAAFLYTLKDHHMEYEVMKYSLADDKKNEAFQTILDFKKMVQEIQGDLGEASGHLVSVCNGVADDLQIYLVFAVEKETCQQDLEQWRTAGDRLRAILATEDKNDPGALTGE